MKGDNYRTPVNYWMPFYGNYGIHDAYWRAEFGGEVYLTNGSHGCVNTPPAAMAQVYANMESGTPVVLIIKNLSIIPNLHEFMTQFELTRVLT